MTDRSWNDYLDGFVRDYPDTELFVYSGPLWRPYDDKVIEAFEERRANLRNNVVLMLTTDGGDPHAAYRIARCIQRDLKLLKRSNGTTKSRSFAVFVDSACYSAGTLIATGATEIIMGDYGELGPLDIQIRKPDETEQDSGLTPTQALDILERRSKSLFKQHFDQLRDDRSFGLTTKTAVEIASNITTGLLSQIYGQIDPMRLGEVERLMGITAEYGERLGKHNLKADALGKLISRYPSHSFVIDRDEAMDLFERVSVPKEGLREFGAWWRPIAEMRMQTTRPVCFFATEARPRKRETSARERQKGNVNDRQKDTGRSGEGTTRTGETPRAPRKRRSSQR